MIIKKIEKETSKSKRRIDQSNKYICIFIKVCVSKDLLVYNYNKVKFFHFFYVMNIIIILVLLLFFYFINNNERKRERKKVK